MNRAVRTSILISVAFLGAFVVAGCLPVPLGNPEQSKIDPKLDGFWLYESQEEGALTILYPFDSHAYVAEVLTFKKENGAPQRKDRSAFKAWRTDVAGQKFITLEPLIQRLASASPENKWYLVMNLKLEKDNLEIRAIDGDFEPVKAAKTPEALAAVIQQHLNDPALMSKESQTYRHLDAEKDQEKIASILKLFEAN